MGDAPFDYKTQMCSERKSVTLLVILVNTLIFVLSDTELLRKRLTVLIKWQIDKGSAMYMYSSFGKETGEMLYIQFENKGLTFSCFKFLNCFKQTNKQKSHFVSYFSHCQVSV